MSDFDEFREEMRKDVREFKAKVERDLRKELRELKASFEFFNTEFEQLKSKNADLVTENEELKASFEFFNAEFEEMKSKNADLVTENEAVKKSNAGLMKDCENLKTQAMEHEQRITASEQYSRLGNLEVKGIPVVARESLPDTLHRIGELLHEPIVEDDIEVCHRVPTKKSDNVPNIVIKFKSRLKRDTVLDKARKARISARDLGYSCNMPVYINKHLCPVLKQLLGMAVAKKKVVNWKLVWSKSGRILARKDESSPIVHIRNAHDIDKIA